MAQEMLRELAPLLAEEGLDVDNLEVPDLQTLQDAMNRAVERRNRELFSPVGPARDMAAATLRDVVRAILGLLADDARHAEELLADVVPNSPDNSEPMVASCMGISLTLLDEWLSGADAGAPAGLAARTRLPKGHWTGGRAAKDILALAARAKAFDSVGSLEMRQGGPQVLAGCALALAVSVRAWSTLTDTPPEELIEAHIR